MISKNKTHPTEYETNLSECNEIQIGFSSPSMEII